MPARSRNEHFDETLFNIGILIRKTVQEEEEKRAVYYTRHSFAVEKAIILVGAEINRSSILCAETLVTSRILQYRKVIPLAKR